MSSNVIPFHYQGKPVRFNSEGWINATDIAAAHGMRLDNWLRNKETEAYTEALARHLNTSDSRDLIRGQRGAAVAPGFTQSWSWHLLAGYRPTLLSGQTYTLTPCCAVS
ncbi:KilA-N domain-containing protein [Pseudomonas aeruginosa]|uniref:KilA-N domain-containing protein n=1 Tax=Pseudomonas aeruginosa TaxID=287 RepID=UPI00233FE968|nr:KilA-N domain-containing protein [Pseudomonas aeruginosa]